MGMISNALFRAFIYLMITSGQLKSFCGEGFCEARSTKQNVTDTCSKFNATLPFKRKASSKAFRECVKSIRTRQELELKRVLANQIFLSRDALLIDPAHHGNVGDNLIAMGEYAALKNAGWAVEHVEECYVEQAMKSLPPCHVVAAANNGQGGGRLAIWSGGGNWGDLYQGLQTKRIESFEYLLRANFTIVSMPQSFQYKSNQAANTDSKKMVRIFEKVFGKEFNKRMSPQKKLILLWRQQNSFEQARILYPFADNRLVPDIAFQVTTPDVPVKADYDILFLLRRDGESTILRSNRTNGASRLNGMIQDLLLKKKVNVSSRVFAFEDAPCLYPNTIQGGRKFDYAKRLLVATSFLESARVVVTDKLHGFVLSFLLQKPVVFMDQSYKKIEHTLATAFSSSMACLDSTALQYANASSLDIAVNKALRFLTSVKLVKGMANR